MRREPPVIEGSANPMAESSAGEVPPAEQATSEVSDQPASDMTHHAVEIEPAAHVVDDPVSAAPTELDPATAPTEPIETASDGRDASRVDTLLTGERDAADARAERRRSNFATAMAVAVVLLAGAVIYLFYQLSFVGPDPSSEIAGLNSRLSEIEARPRPDIGAATKQAAAAEQAASEAKSGLAALTKRVDAVAAPAPPQPNLQPQVTELQASLTDMRKSVATLQANVASLPRPDLAPIEARLHDLDGRISGLQGAVSAIPHVDLGPLTGRVDALDGRLKPLETEMKATQSPEHVAERRAAPVAVTAQAVIAAITADHPFPREFHALQALGTDPAKLAPLQVVAANGAPSLRDLRDDLAQARDRIIAQGAPAPSGSYMDRLMSGAGNLVQVRPLGSVVGDTPAAIVARINDEIGADDLAAALADWQKLPASSQAASESFPERLKLRLDAQTAARDVAADAVGAMAAPGTEAAPRG